LGGDIQRCSDLGIGMYLIKPIKQSELLQSILSLLGKTRPTKVGAQSVSVSTAPVIGKSLRILVAEDNAVNQQVAIGLLQELGHQATIVGNGKLAIQALEKDNFDVVLMDIQMPEMDGFQATAAIRTKEKGSSHHLPIVALTSHAMTGYREECLNAGMDD